MDEVFREGISGMGLAFLERKSFRTKGGNL
jgi:hypothetical protein